MDEVLCLCAVDFAGRSAFVMDAEFKSSMVGEFPTQCVYDFFKAFSDSAQINLQLKVFNARNDHHVIEAMFKAFARAVREACEMDPRALDSIPSTKGVL